MGAEESHAGWTIGREGEGLFLSLELEVEFLKRDLEELLLRRVLEELLLRFELELELPDREEESLLIGAFLFLDEEGLRTLEICEGDRGTTRLLVLEGSVRLLLDSDVGWDLRGLEALKRVSCSLARRRTSSLSI